MSWTQSTALGLISLLHRYRQSLSPSGLPCYSPHMALLCFHHLTSLSRLSHLTKEPSADTLHSVSCSSNIRRLSLMASKILSLRRLYVSPQHHRPYITVHRGAVLPWSHALPCDPILGARCLTAVMVEHSLRMMGCQKAEEQAMQRDEEPSEMAQPILSTSTRQP